MRSLIDPVWFLLTVLTFTIFVKVGSTKLCRVVKLLARVSISMLVFLSTGVATIVFDQILASETTPKSDWSPEFIFVLGGGYELGVNKAQDFLGTESTRRVNAAAALWQKYPQSFVVFSGRQPGTETERSATRHGELSSEHAISLGLTETRIIIESASSNTREHPTEALKLSEVKHNDQIAIVTSDFHLRRATYEFEKYFLNVEAFGTGVAASGFSWLDFVPLATHLDENTYRIKEFAGIIIIFLL